MRRRPRTGAMNNSRCPFFVVLLLAVWTGLSTNSCSKTPDQSAQRQRDSIASLLDAYIDGYRTGEWGKVRFTADVTFEGTLKGPISGESTVRTEEHTSELQSRVDLVCCLLIEKKKEK